MCPLFVTSIIQGSYPPQICDCTQWPKRLLTVTRHHRLGWPRLKGTTNKRNFQYPLVNLQKAMENGHRNSEFSHQKWWFSRATLNYQRVYLMGKSWNAMENGFILWFPLDFLSHHPNRSIDFCDLHRRISQDFFSPVHDFFCHVSPTHIMLAMAIFCSFWGSSHWPIDQPRISNQNHGNKLFFNGIFQVPSGNMARGHPQ